MAALSVGQIAPQSKFNFHSRQVVNHLDIMDLYPAQIQALKNLQAHFEDSTKENIALVVLPTGAGKSGVAVLAPFVLNSTNVLIITPSVVISKQLYIDMCGAGETCFFAKRNISTVEDSHKFTENGLLVTGTLGDSNATLHNFRMHHLVIANAQKFGSNSSFDMAKLPNDVFDTIIVDEAHHYPAATWKRIVDHFGKSKRVFLTATPFHNGQNILGDSMEDQSTRFLAYQLTREYAVSAGMIRDLKFDDNVFQDSVNIAELIPVLEHNMQRRIDQNEVSRIVEVVLKLNQILNSHDEVNVDVAHQAMILCYQKNEVDLVVLVINCLNLSPSSPTLDAVAYHGDSGREGFDAFRSAAAAVDGGGAPPGPRFLVVCGKATEGFDRRQVSAVGILRNVSPASAVLFSQFVGRCVRRTGPNDLCTAYVVSHPDHQQRQNFEKMDTLAEVDPVDE